MLATATVVTAGFLVQRKFSILQSEVSNLRLEFETLTKQFLASSSVRATSRSLGDTCPFTCDDQWCTADEDKYFLFKQGIVIGAKNTECDYGTGILSVHLYNPRKTEGGGSNCPKGAGTVTFGQSNEALGMSSVVSGGSFNKALEAFASVSGGENNEASGKGASVSGGNGNKAINDSSSISGGQLNEATGSKSSVSGGYANKAEGWVSSVSGGEKNIAGGESSSVSGGYNNKASGEYYASVSGGYGNMASGDSASVSGGIENIASGEYSSISGGHKNNSTSDSSSVSGGLENVASGLSSSVSGGNKNTASNDFSSNSPFTHSDDGKWWVAEDSHFLFTKGIVIGRKNPKCTYGAATLSVDVGKNNRGTNCPGGVGSVTFGSTNIVGKKGPTSSILGGLKNKIGKRGSSILGGRDNVINKAFETSPASD